MHLINPKTIKPGIDIAYPIGVNKKLIMKIKNIKRILHSKPTSLRFKCLFAPLHISTAGVKSMITGNNTIIRIQMAKFFTLCK